MIKVAAIMSAHKYKLPGYPQSEWKAMRIERREEEEQWLRKIWVELTQLGLKVKESVQQMLKQMGETDPEHRGIKMGYLQFI